MLSPEKERAGAGSRAQLRPWLPSACLLEVSECHAKRAKRAAGCPLQAVADTSPVAGLLLALLGSEVGVLSAYCPYCPCCP